MPVWGWDASHYDGPLTPTILAQAKAEGVAFFTHKLGEGLSDTEGTMDDTALAAARSVGIPFIGGYVVPRTLDSAAQVDYWWQILNNSEPWWRDHPGWFNQVDLERWSYDPVSAAKGVDCAKRWRDKTGRQTILYASHGQYGDELTAWDGPLWNADYTSRPVAGFAAMYPGDDWQPLHGTWRGGWAPYSGKTPTILQYTSSATIAGLSTCDANAFRGTIDQLRSLITGETMLKDEQITLSSIDGKGTETHDAATWLGYACRDAYLGWQTAAAAKTAVDALTVKLDALAKLVTDGSGNPDVAGALAHFDAGIADLKAQESATVQTLQARIDRLQAALAAAEQAAAGALTPPAA